MSVSIESPLEVRRSVPVGLELVSERRGPGPAPLIRLRLNPGDRLLVAAGDAVVPGTPIAERTRDLHQATAEVPGRVTTGGGDGPPATAPAEPAEPAAKVSGSAGSAASHAAGARPSQPAPGRWWPGGESSSHRPGRRRSHRGPGELLYEIHGRWHIATGEHHETLHSPVAGIVRQARPGIAVAIETGGLALPAALAAGEPSRGRLELAAGADGELRAAGLDVGRTGSILVVGSRVDAETLTRARAMGIRGVIAAAISSRDLRDLAASERRQRAGLQVTTPFGVLVLDGFVRRRIASPVMALLAALAGHEVAISTDPPCLIFDPAGMVLPSPPPGWVRVHHGEGAGREGIWLGLAGLRRFRGGVQLEGAFVKLDADEPAVVPLSDLERFA